MPQKKALEHWPVILLIGVFALVFLVSLCLFQVQTTEYAMVKRLGKALPERDTSPGLHWKLPWPIEEVWRHDNRIQVFEGSTGQLEEIYTKDGINIIVTLYVGWKVGDATARSGEQTGDKERFMNAVVSQADAEQKLTSLMRDKKHSIFGEYDFSQLVNIDEQKVKLTEIEGKLRVGIGEQARKDFGIEVTLVGIKHIGLPEKVTQKVFDRMKAERKRIADEITSEGKADADAIRAKADAEMTRIVSEARNAAKLRRAEAEAIAAQSYGVFKDHEELAIFLLQLDAIRQTLSAKTTLVFDTETPPFNVFSPESFRDLGKTITPAPAPQKP